MQAKVDVCYCIIFVGEPWKVFLSFAPFVFCQLRMNSANTISLLLSLSLWERVRVREISLL